MKNKGILNKIIHKKEIKIIFYSIVITLLAVALLWIYFKFIKQTPKEEIITNSNLQSLIQIDELNSSQFNYSGIAQMYNDTKNKKLLCNVYYKANVKLGVNLKDVTFNIDEENKTVAINVPEPKIQLIEIDPKSLDFIPDKKKLELDDIISTCKNDADKEIKDDDGVFLLTKNNVSSMIEALILPQTKKLGYKIVKDDE